MRFSFLILITLSVILVKTMAAPRPLCQGLLDSENEIDNDNLDPSKREQLIMVLANKYPSFYKKIENEPCFEQLLKKMKYLVDPLWNEFVVIENLEEDDERKAISADSPNVELVNPKK